MCSKTQIYRVFKNKQKKNNSVDPQEIRTSIIPYAHYETAKISRLLAKYNYKTFFCTNGKICVLLHSVKDDIGLKNTMNLQNSLWVWYKLYMVDD